MSRKALHELPLNHPTRQPTYRPADPTWARTEELMRVRQFLHELDPKLEIWFVPKWKSTDPKRPGRWGIVYWMARARTWSVVFYLENSDGSYQDVSTDCLIPIANRLKACEEDPHEQNRKVEEQKLAREEKEAAEFYEATAEAEEGLRPPELGGRIVTAMSGQLKRRHAIARGLERNNSHARYLEQWQNRRRT